MTHNLSNIESSLLRTRKTWVVTGAAGFIGSHLLQRLLTLKQQVKALDNFSTGKQDNLTTVRRIVGEKLWSNLEFVEGSIANVEVCQRVCYGADFVLHQAALGSVPRSVAEPQKTHVANVDGFINMLEAARANGIKRFVYASSSSVYGDSLALPKVEGQEGQPLSPYAASKAINEIYAQAWAHAYGMQLVGLRYFNVFGPRQDPLGAYAAVIPRWINQLLQGQEVVIFGDGQTSRDFCYVDNAVQANILAALSTNVTSAIAINIGCNARTTLNDLFSMISTQLKAAGKSLQENVRYSDFRAGDVRHSLAALERAKEIIGYEPQVDISQGLIRTVQSYLS